MKNYGLGERIAELRDALSLIESAMSDAGNEVPDGLDDLQRAVDETRKSVWAVLTAANSAQYNEFLARVRVQRGCEVFHDVRTDLEGGHIGLATPGLDELEESLRDLVATMSTATAVEQDTSNVIETSVAQIDAVAQGSEGAHE